MRCIIQVRFIGLGIVSEWITYREDSFLQQCRMLAQHTIDFKVEFRQIEVEF